MRLLFCRTLASLFIVAALLAITLKVEEASIGDGLVSGVAKEMFSRPAYAKKNKDKGDREAGKASKWSQEKSFKQEPSFKETTKPTSSSSSGSNSSSSSSSFSGSSSKDNASTFAKTPAKSDTKSTTSSKGTTKPGNSDADDDVDVDAPAATVKDFIQKVAQPPRKRRPAAPSIESIDRDPQSVGNQGNDILVQGISSAQTQQAIGLGLVPVDSTNVPAIGVNVTRFRVPGNMGRGIARELVRERFGISGFPENHTYVIYAPMEGEGAKTPDVVPDFGARTGQCREDRCIGRAAICWSDEIAGRTKAVKIGIIDTAIDRDHPAFAGRKISVGTFLNGHTRTEYDWHGTAVLALLAGAMESGVPGLAPDSEFFVAETFRTDEQGNATTDTASIIKALAWLDSQQVHVINMSFSGPRDGLVEQAIQRMRANGVTFVAAAGNFGPVAAPSYPAAYKEVIAVTAITKDGYNYPSANRGDYVDLAAPGVRIWTALPGGKEGFRTGTSFAAPFVTGILAAKLSSGTAHKAEADDLKLIKTFDLGPPGIDPIFGRGLALASTACRSNIASSPPPTTASIAGSSAEPTATTAAAPAPSFGEMTVFPAGAPSFSP